MADFEAQSTLSVEVQGEDSINRLAAALRNLQSQADQVQRAVSAAPGRVTPAAAQRAVQNVYEQGLREFDTLGSRLAYRLSYGVGSGLRSGFDALRSGASIAGRAVAAFAGPLGQVASSAGPTAIAVIGVGAAIAGLAAPILSFIAGLKLLRSSFGWAQEAAQEQLRVAGRTRRFYPQLLGEGLEAAESEMETRMTVAGALFGDAAEAMQEQVTRRFTAFRMGRGLRGERDIFARWGITPENVSRFEKIAGTRIDISGWLNQFVLKREDLEQRLARASSPQERGMLQYKLGVLMDDTTKLFGQKFSDQVGVMTSVDLARLNTNIRAAIPLGEVEGATRRAKDFQIGLQSIKATFAAITKGIGLDVQPSITNFLGALNQKLLDTEQGGQGLGRAFRNLASSMANRAWDALSDIMRRIDIDKVNSWINAIQQWEPAKTADSVRQLITGVLQFGSSIASLITNIKAFIDALPSWAQIKRTIRGPNIWDRSERAPSGPGGPTAGGEATFAERFGALGGGGGEAFGGGAGAAQAPPAPSAAPAAPPAAPAPPPVQREGIFGAMRRGGAGAVAAAAAPPPVTPAPVTPTTTPTAPPPTGGTGAAPGAPSAPAGPSAAATAPATAGPTAPAPTAAGGPTPPTAAPSAAPLAETIPATGPLAAPSAPAIAAPGAPPSAPQTPAGPPVPTPTEPEPKKRPWYDPRGWFSRTAAASELGGEPTGPTAAGAIPSAPPPPVTAAMGAPPAPRVEGGEAAGEQPAPSRALPTRAGISSTTMDTLKGAAAGRAMSMMTDVERGPGGDAIVMKAGFKLPPTPEGSFPGAGALSAAGTAAGFLVPGALGGAIEATTHGALYGATGSTYADALRETIPGMGLLGAMKRDAEQGHPVRTYLRDMLGLPDPGEPAPWQRGQRDERAEALTAPFADRYGSWSGGITAEDGTNFGTAAAESLKQGINGLSIGGTPSTSYGVSPRTAPKPTGGDTATEA